MRGWPQGKQGSLQEALEGVLARSTVALLGVVETNVGETDRFCGSQQSRDAVELSRVAAVRVERGD